MKSECTLNDLVDYLYNETQLLKTVEVQYTIDNNEEVKKSAGHGGYFERIG